MNDVKVWQVVKNVTANATSTIFAAQAGIELSEAFSIVRSEFFFLHILLSLTKNDLIHFFSGVETSTHPLIL